jgi:hypothetical protein
MDFLIELSEASAHDYADARSFTFSGQSARKIRVAEYVDELDLVSVVVSSPSSIIVLPRGLKHQNNHLSQLLNIFLDYCKSLRRFGISCVYDEYLTLKIQASLTLTLVYEVSVCRTCISYIEVTYQK